MNARNLEQEIDALTKSLESIRGELSGLSDRLGDTAADALDTGRRGVRRAARVAGSAAHEVAGRARQGVSVLQDEIGERPLASMAVVFAVGVLAGCLMRR